MRTRAVNIAASIALAPMLLGGAPANDPAGAAAIRPGGEVRPVVEVDLEGAIRMALERSPELSALASDALAADARRDQAAAERWPAVRAVGGVTEYLRAQRLYPAGVPGEPAVVSHQVGAADAVVTIPLFTGGRLAESVRAADASAQASRAVRERSRAEVAFTVTALYFGILSQREVIRALRASEGALEEHLRRLTALTAEGKAAPIDALRIDVRLAATRQRRVQEEATLDVLAQRMAATLGMDASSVSVVVVGRLEPGPAAPAVGREATRAALDRRGDRAALAATVRAEEARLGSVRAAHWGQLSLQGSYGYRWGFAPVLEPPGLSRGADVGQVALLLDIPLFLGGKLSAAVREQEARLASAHARLAQLDLRIASEIEAAATSAAAAEARLEPAAKAAAQAADAFRLETEKHVAGKSTISDVLGAQVDLVDAEATQARAIADVRIAIAALRLATGEAP